MKRKQFQKRRQYPAGVLSFGKYEGRRIADVPGEYLEWLAKHTRQILSEVDSEITRRQENGIHVAMIPAKDSEKKTRKGKMRITEVGQPCRHRGTPVERRTHIKPPEPTPSGFYFEWWLKCPKCKSIYVVESAKRFLHLLVLIKETPAMKRKPKGEMTLTDEELEILSGGSQEFIDAHKAPGFQPSGLDEMFLRILRRRAEAIVKGWIVALEDEPAQMYVDQLRAVEPDEPEKKEKEEKEEKEVKR